MSTSYPHGGSGESDDYLLPSELAKEWKIRVRTLEQWRYRRTGPPYVKIGGRVRYSRKAAGQWAAAQAVEPQGAA
jgi:hypothetical protein